MKRQIVLLVAVFSLAFLCCVSTGTAQDVGKVILGEIHIPEISGAAFLPNDRLLVVKDEDQIVFLLEQASQKLLTGKVTEEDFTPITLAAEVDDLEDVAWDGKSNVVFVTSHSRSRRGRTPARRSTIVRTTLDGLRLDKAFTLEVPAELQSSMERTPAQAGFNIEGAALHPDGRLLLGLRSPTRTVDDDTRNPNEDAILLEVRDLSASRLKAAAVNPGLDLKGGGIRGMSYDPEAKGLWIVAGLSPDPPDGIVDKASSALWFLHDDGTLKRMELPCEAKHGLGNVEAVTRGSIGGAKEPHLLLVEDGSEVGGISRYVLFPVPKQ